MRLLQEIGWYGIDKLEVWELNEAGDLLSRMSVRRAKNQLLIEQYEVNPQLETAISPNLAIILALQLENQIEAQIEGNEIDIPAKLLGVEIEDSSDFIWQTLLMDDQIKLACLTRKQSLSRIWNRLGPIKKQVLYLNLSRQSLKLLSGPPSENASQDELMRRLEIPAKALYPYSVAMQYFRQYGQDLHAWPGNGDFRNRLIKNSRWIKRLSLLSALCLCILCVLNITQNQLSQKIKRAEQHIAQQRIIIHEIDSLTQQIEHYQRYKEQSIKPAASQVSYFLDRTATSAPSDLNFRHWIYQPSAAQRKKLTLNKALNPLLLIQGSAQSSKSIAQFAQKLQNLIPDKKVDLQQSTYDIQQGNYQFLLLIL